LKNKILITGGAGFIGSNYVELVISNSEDEVFILDNLTYAGNLKNLKAVSHLPNYNFIKGDICDKTLINNLFTENRFNKVIHFAAESHVDNSITGPSAFIQTNIIGTFNLVHSAYCLWMNGPNQLKKDFKDARFLHVSTDEVYGTLGDTGLFTETTAYAPNSPYSASKASSDFIVRSYFHTYGMPVKISNCSNNYGSHQFPEKLIPLMIHNIKLNKPLPVYGEGLNIRDWLWVNDHARAIDVIFHNGKLGETYNIGGNNEWTNIDLVKLLCRTMDKKLDRAEGESEKLITYVTDRAGHDMRYAIDASKIKRELGWEPSITFEVGLEQTVEWYLNNEEWLTNVTSGEYQGYYEKQYK